MLELWFDFSCPYAYLASRQVAVWEAAGIEVDWRPMLLGGVFRGIASGPGGNGPMPTLSRPKARHNDLDLQRWASLVGAPLQLPAAHPMRTVRALRTLLALPRREWSRAIHALYATYWVRAEDIASDRVISAALHGAGIAIADVAAALAAADSDATKAELHARTDAAIALGMFGAPGWVMRHAEGHTLVWGQDRFNWVDAMRTGWNPDRDPPPGGPKQIEANAAIAGSTLDVYFDVSSPFAYLGLAQLRHLAHATGVTPKLIPILLGGLFRDLGQVDVPLAAMPAAKQRYVTNEMQRWARWHGIPFEPPKKFPQRTVTAQRLLCLAAGEPRALELAVRLGRAMWAEQADLEDPEVLRTILVATSFPPEWIERTAEPEVKQALITNTTRAKDIGAFGVPTFVVNGEHLFWGQDRLDFVARALSGWTPENK